MANFGYTCTTSCFVAMSFAMAAPMASPMCMSVAADITYHHHRSQP